MMPDPSIPDERFVDGLLAAVPVLANHALKEAIFEQSSSRLRRQRRMRMVGRVGLLAACFLGGMGAMAMLHSPEVVEKIVVVSVPKEAVPAVVDTQPNPIREKSPAQLEMEAESTTVKAESARRFREAGDRYLRDEANYGAALRCYRNFLDEAEETDLRPSESDTYLLVSLINARKKEKSNVQADR